MHLWNVNALIDDFAYKKITEQQKFRYILLYVALMTIVSNSVLYVGTKYSHELVVELVLSVLITIWGMNRCFTINQSNGGDDFISRYVCIGFPVGIRLFVFAVPIFLIIGVVEAAMQTDPTFHKIQMYIKMAQVPIFSVIYYLYLGKKLKELTTKAASVSSEVAEVFE